MSINLISNINSVLAKTQVNMNKLKDVDDIIAAGGGVTKKKPVRKNNKKIDIDDDCDIISVEQYKHLSMPTSDDERTKTNTFINKIKEDTILSIQNINISDNDSSSDDEESKIKAKLLKKDKKDKRKQRNNSSDSDMEELAKFNDNIQPFNNLSQIKKDTKNEEITNKSTKLEKAKKPGNKIQLEFKPIPEAKEYFNYLSVNLENRNIKLDNYINYMKDIILEEKITDINLYLKTLNAIINNYKMLFGYIVYIKDYDTRSNPEIFDLFSIIAQIINRNSTLIQDSGYVIMKKNNIFQNKLSNGKSCSIQYFNVKELCNIEIFVPKIKQEDFCYLNKYVILSDVINTFVITWYIILMHLTMCKNIISNDSIDIKKIRDKGLAISTDTNLYTKQFLACIKKKPKIVKESEISVKNKGNKAATNVTLNPSFERADILSLDNEKPKEYDLKDITDDEIEDVVDNDDDDVEDK